MNTSASLFAFIQRRHDVLAKLIPTRLWTRRCSAQCGDSSPHDSHLTWLGRKALGI